MVHRLAPRRGLATFAALQKEESHLLWFGKGITPSRLLCAIAGMATAVFGACAFPAAAPAAEELRPALMQLYTSVSILPPTATRMTVCYGYVCRRRDTLDFTPADRKALTAVMNAGKANAAAERVAFQKAMVWFDRRVGPMLGTTKRVANADFRFTDKENFDCWDTTRNTTSLLLVLQSWNLIKHHTIGDPHYRGNVLMLQTPHNTAVVVERATGKEWVVDMWTRAYAEMPDVMPVEQWAKLN